MWRASFLIMCRESVEIRRRDAAGLIKRSSQEKNRRNQRRFVRPRINTDRNNGVSRGLLAEKQDPASRAGVGSSARLELRPNYKQNTSYAAPSRPPRILKIQDYHSVENFCRPPGPTRSPRKQPSLFAQRPSPPSGGPDRTQKYKMVEPIPQHRHSKIE
jgi:hypothetical protein